MDKIPSGTLVVTTRKLVGDCHMFIAETNTIARVIYHLPKEKEIKLVITPYAKGYITTDDRCIRELTACEQIKARILFNSIPEYEFEPATLK
jgi:hypothetical protein